MKQKVPKFDGTSYATWKILVVLWTSVTDIEKEKQGAYLVMNMSGKALEIALNEDNSSVDNLIKKLDEVYGESNDKGYTSAHRTYKGYTSATPLRGAAP